MDSLWYPIDRRVIGSANDNGIISIKEAWGVLRYYGQYDGQYDVEHEWLLQAYETVIEPISREISLDINPTSLSFKAEGGKQTVTISCEENWIVSNNTDWITCSPMGSPNPNAKTLTVTVKPNTTTQKREAIITVSGKYHTTVSKNIHIIQDGIQNIQMTFGGVRYYLDYSTMTATLLEVETDESGRGEVIIPESLEIMETSARETRAGTSKNFKVKSIGDSIMTRMALNMKSLNCVTFPEGIETVSEKAFDGAKTKSLVWLSDTEMPKNAFQSLIDDKLVNMLVYVNKADLAPIAVTNKIVRQNADGSYCINNLELIEDNEFYCPQKFEAGKVTFKHSFNMTTGIRSNGNGAQGWESIVLPFDVETISYEKDGHTFNLVPFDNYEQNFSNNDRPFWLYEWNGTAFKSATKIVANKPYLISMPNNSEYAADYCISGNVVFSARNEEVKETDVEDAYTGIQPQKGFYATYAFLNNEIISGRNILCINSESKVSGHDHLAYDYSDYAIGDEPKPGSLFMSLALIKRDWGAYPFEGFMLSDSPNGTRETINIEFTAADSQGIEEIIQATPTEHFEKGIYTLSGQYIGNFKNSHSQLPKGIYIVDGKKKNVK